MRTRVEDAAGLEPKWNQVFDVKISDFNEEVRLECLDSGATSDTIIGKTSFNISKFMQEGEVSDFIEIFHEGKSVGKINVKSKFTIDDSKQI